MHIRHGVITFSQLCAVFQPTDLGGKAVTKDLEAYDVITKLLNLKNYPRLTYKVVYLHLIFWTWDRRFRFLVDSCEVLKQLKKENKNSNILRDINSLGRIALDGDDDVLDVLSFGAKDIEGLRYVELMLKRMNASESSSKEDKTIGKRLRFRSKE
ncbi:hypothetical protein Tco_0307350 [Tanacetum coccineum]